MNLATLRCSFKTVQIQFQVKNTDQFAFSQGQAPFFHP